MAPNRDRPGWATSSCCAPSCCAGWGTPEARRTAEAAAALFGGTAASAFGPSREQVARAAALRVELPRF
ncbi:hypothetical protein ACQPYE_10820 [Actinosynnema sp. CA-299493]